MAWLEFLASCMLFIASHSILLRPAIKQQLVQSLGQRVFTFAYSALSIAILIWVISAAGRAPYVELWAWGPWQNLVPVFGMLISVAILSLSIGRPNPFSFGGSTTMKFNSQEPGLVKFTRHPLLLALSIWAFTHIVPNGNLAHVLLFGGFGLFALVGMKAIDARKKRELGDTQRHELLIKCRTSGPGPGLPLRMATGRLTAGFFLYIGLLYSHGWLIGVSPLG
ncbi:MAG: NnrU family protein [Rhizobiaceae bacterium]